MTSFREASGFHISPPTFWLLMSYHGLLLLSRAQPLWQRAPCEFQPQPLAYLVSTISRKGLLLGLQASQKVLWIYIFIFLIPRFESLRINFKSENLRLEDFLCYIMPGMNILKQSSETFKHLIPNAYTFVTYFTIILFHSNAQKKWH